MNQILKNKPKINRKYALKLSNIIHRSSKKYKIPAQVYTAILMQESSYQVSAVNCYTGINNISKEDTICADFGIAQIHYKTIQSYKFNRNKLVKDLEYSVNAGAKVLAWFHKKYSRKEPKTWWVRYNCGTAKSTNRVTCNNYKRLVFRYL